MSKYVPGALALEARTEVGLPGLLQAEKLLWDAVEAMESQLAAVGLPSAEPITGEPRDIDDRNIAIIFEAFDSWNPFVRAIVASNQQVQNVIEEFSYGDRDLLCCAADMRFASPRARRIIHGHWTDADRAVLKELCDNTMRVVFAPSYNPRHGASPALSLD